ncbi:hypothetical protein CR513_36013, partial [Mucuna pruriens]
MAPDRSCLQNLSKANLEGFKDYAHKWHELAAQVQSPLSEKEMVTMFINTLPSPFYDKALGSVASSFADLVTVGERIDSIIKRGKFAQANTSGNFAKKTRYEKKKAEANAILIDPTSQGKGSNLANPSNASSSQPSGRSRVFAPLPMTYMALFPFLLQKNMIAVLPSKPLEPPYSKSYNPNAKCDYHAGAVRHSRERCWGFKHKVRDLIDGG